MGGSDVDSMDRKHSCLRDIRQFKANMQTNLPNLVDTKATFVHQWGSSVVQVGDTTMVSFSTGDDYIAVRYWDGRLENHPAG